MKKIIITISDNKEKESCSVNVKLEDNKKASEQEKRTASVIYNAVIEKLNDLRK